MKMDENGRKHKKIDKNVRKLTKRKKTDETYENGRKRIKTDENL